ncbi:YhjD/YihY/BrkB family envelope integrity protein [Nocardioides mesophilus]|uniref:YihY/virulence factor BrkB family protein n=1 Tax=Nocardioides mesophilus TaxID=433659 RepID=A0A7G9RB39_9ACTN|nr:YhjD/YihY/BrkB family envelope integrity protein [Nocardioides mesophilus]QNN52814.1 YihY/virulence factor BrkB family protein [Nocardioides mesophilus]
MSAGGGGTTLFPAFPAAHRLVSELARIELIDRSLAIGAQALLALIPLLVLVGALLPDDAGTTLLNQVRDVMGVHNDVMQPLRDAGVSPDTQVQAGALSLVVAVGSATSFSRALQRMYARVWELPTFRGVRAVRGSLLWLLGWVATLQISALLLRSLTGLPLVRMAHLGIQLVVNVLLWWWTARLLLGGRVSWRLLFPGALVSGVLVVLLAYASQLFMPRFASAQLTQFGALGVVFAIASWLVLFGGTLVVSAVLGRLITSPAGGEAGGPADDDAGGKDQS